MWYLLDWSVRNIQHIKADFFFKVVCGHGSLGSSLHWRDQLMDSSSCRGERMYLYAHKFILINVSLAVT